MSLVLLPAGAVLLLVERHRTQHRSDAMVVAAVLLRSQGKAMVFSMAHRNRLFTVLKNGGSFHGELLNNKRVYVYIYIHIMYIMCMYIYICT